MSSLDAPHSPFDRDQRVADRRRWPLASAVRDSKRGPLPAGTPAAVQQRAAELLGAPLVPSTGVGESAALDLIAGLLDRDGIDLSHPHAAAHLQPPVLQVAVDADALASASNASMDTYDSGPATLAIEQWVVRALATMAGFGPAADGVLTPGGSISNLLAVLIARDSAAAALGIDVRRNGLAGLEKPVVFCSELAHFSVQRACAALGLGEDAAITIQADGDFRLRPDILSDELGKPGRTPIAVVATAGTTDYGSIDPIAEIAGLARQHGAWVHVDAAYGFGALFSDRLAPLLAELPFADSVTLDLHKIGWQPAATSMLLVADRDRFAALGRSVDYLNPADDIDSGLDGLLGRSLQTTRRPDAVKVATTLTAYGRAGLGKMLDTCHELAHAAAARVVADSQLELLAPVTLTTVLFRVAGRGLAAAELDAVQGEVRRRLLTSGRVLIGRTRIPARGGRPAAVALKLTLLNPNATVTDIEDLLDQVVATGHDVLSREGAA
ncbi:pyridoxal-dependent decarboxylase [Streptomyces sp. SID13031]|uniref:pyridoxal phosphate-dependent decarboxylase family protein n=1 Tax=Streptomyces sp. SID13031 TaxID=2706046 RepID=UPI0013CA6370|nr:pyridoxal-dependent decarboxylase [Streptomyces sp. SID13031]NEA32906.1 aminotransferase class V-fold PLP-dependent enzyme [Streptomyces sp. SID13031]